MLQFKHQLFTAFIKYGKNIKVTIRVHILNENFY